MPRQAWMQRSPPRHPQRSQGARDGAIKGGARAVNSINESPMFISVMRGYEDITKVLLEIEDSAHGATFGFNALHAAVRNGNPGETYNRKILEIGVRNFIMSSQL